MDSSEAYKSNVRELLICSVVCALAGMTILVEAMDSQHPLEHNGQLHVHPNQMWKGNDCSSPLPEHMALRCRPRKVIKLTTAFYGRKFCNDVDFSCAGNFTMAREMCNGKQRCTIDRATLRAEHCGLLSMQKQFVYLQYQCDTLRTTQDEPPDLVAIVTGVLVAFLLLVLIFVVVILWRRTKKLTNVAKMQTLALQRMGTNSKPKTSFANMEYNLDSIILPNRPVPQKNKDNSLERHEYADVDELKMDKITSPSIRSKCPTPQLSDPLSTSDCHSSRYLTLLDSTSVPPGKYSDYVNSTDEEKATLPLEDPDNPGYHLASCVKH